MDKKIKIQEFKELIRKVRFSLMCKGMELDIAKQKITHENVVKINELKDEIQILRLKLSELTKKIQDLKFAYRVQYEVTFNSSWPLHYEKQVFDEIIYLDIDEDIDLPQGEWDLRKTNQNNFLLDLLLLLKYDYDEVILLKVKRLK